MAVDRSLSVQKAVKILKIESKNICFSKVVQQATLDVLDQLHPTHARSNWELGSLEAGSTTWILCLCFWANFLGGDIVCWGNHYHWLVHLIKTDLQHCLGRCCVSKNHVRNINLLSEYCIVKKKKPKLSVSEFVFHIHAMLVTGILFLLLTALKNDL